MFSLIISIIAIALVAALALASIYYGGSAFQEGSADAEASTAVNQGQQIQAAITMAKVKEDWAATAVDFGKLSEKGYLKEIPKLRDKPWVYADGAAHITVPVKNIEICGKIEEKGDALFDAEAQEAAETPAYPTRIEAQPFGCYAAAAAGTGVLTAYYKL